MKNLRSIFLSTFPASLILFLLSVYVYADIQNSLPMQAEGEGVLAALQRKGKLSSAVVKCGTSAAYRPCSAFGKGETNFHLRHLIWFQNWQGTRRCSNTFKGLSEDGGQTKFAENSAPLHLKERNY
jgi:hypothetical protein